MVEAKSDHLHFNPPPSRGRKSEWFRRIVLALVLCSSASAADATTADDLCGPTDDPCVVSGTHTVDDGSTIQVGTRELLVRGRLDVGPGAMQILAGTLTVTGELRAIGNDSTSGGTITALAAAIAIDGDIDVSGSSGGSVHLGAAQAIAVAGNINADHRAGDEGGGSISLEGGRVDVSGALSARGGDDDSGGDVSISTTENALVFAGTIDVSGGDGGDIDLGAAGDLTLTSSGTVRTDATLAGCDGGDLDLSAGNPDHPSAKLVMEGRLLSAGHAGNEDDGGGSGGTLTMTATGDVELMRASALVSSTGAKPDGFGGDVEITSGGALFLRTPIDVSASGNDGAGGSLTIDAGGAIDLAGNVAAVGDGGGDVDAATSGERLTVASGIEIDTRATGGSGGGTIMLSSEGELSVAGSLRTDGSNNRPGSLVQLTACTLNVERTATVSSLRMQGRNVLVGRAGITIAGRLRADAGTGANELHFRSAESPPVIVAGASIDPPATEIVDAALQPCGEAPTPTATMTSAATATNSPSATVPALSTATPTLAAPTSTPTTGLTPTLPAPVPCVGDCNQDGAVTVDELILATDIILGRAPLERCASLDRNGDQVTTVDEPIAAVTASLAGCLP